MEQTEDEKSLFGYYQSLFEPFKNNYDYLFNDNDKKSKSLDDGDKEYKFK